MPNIPSISVIIPCFNAEKWIGAAVRSVLAQAWDGPLEILVIDDGSQDNSVSCVREFGNAVRLIEQANLGAAAARNHGIQEATGRWIAFLDADDIWLPGKLNAQWSLLRANPGVRMCYTGWHVWHCLDPDPRPELVNELDKAAEQNPERWSGPSGWIYPELLADSEIATITVLMERSLLVELRGFDSTLRIGEDYDLWIRASRISQILRVPSPLALYRMNPNSLTKGAPDCNHQAIVVERALHTWGYEGPDGRQAARRHVQRALARTWRNYASAHLAAGNLIQARAGLREALRHRPSSWPSWCLAARLLAAPFIPGRESK